MSTFICVGKKRVISYYLLVIYFVISVFMWTYLWQNFLIDSKIRSYIADKTGDLYKKLACEALIEIWPGKWSITKLIHQISNNFMVIEKDEQLIQNLEFKDQNWELNVKQIIGKDVLEVDVEKILKEKKIKTENTLIVWNLPYYITSPILRKFFANWSPKFPWWIFMLQNEVWEKIRFDAKKKSYLWWLLNYWYDVTYLKLVPAKAFKPAPKVKSCLVQLTMKTTLASYGTTENPTIKRESLVSFLDFYSGFSRKTLWAIQKILTKQGKILFQIPEKLEKKRLEELDREDLREILN
jgi:16S rRNA A1518/A1519 N6-dimethyltransferase RsmA/KsgA/DIM1 with predicted DNA glycosylase/AP lyase activity